ncbi:MAG: sigma-54-dependent Fis family transcriptional regulator [Alphaproteobacteria bacterium]|nr:sigma-54-dependent Fis family transcriptional regulator [Alphaproteobacteria bacterium]MCB9793824.1 sigma-54-dependent Fis family transcriptional regulator [Alphaproteobacteria bacterium]
MKPPTPLRAPEVDPFLGSMLDLLDEPAILLSRDYRVLAANSAYVERYGGALRVGQDRCHYVSHRYDTPCDLNGESCPLRACLERDGPARVTHVHHTPRGPEHCEILLQPLRDESGRIQRFIERIRPLDGATAQPAPEGLLGRSRAFSQVLEQVERVAGSALPVLLLGESGTGKERIARALHERSARSAGPFVPVECSGLASTLFESELFGHERGAFTGADRRHEGLVDAARGGTLFLDEIGDVPLSQQVKLLRLLETGTYRRVGGQERVRADFRLICATHRDLVGLVGAGQFRQDLLYRINAFPIRLPPLRERREDIALLAEAFLAGRRRIHPEALAALQAWRFPGNVRELRNALERAVLLSDGQEIEPRHLPPDIGPSAPAGDDTWPWGGAVIPLDELERRYLSWVVEKGGTREELAEHLGVSLRTLYRKLETLRED